MGLLNIDCNLTTNTTTSIIAAKYVLDLSANDGHRDVSANTGIQRAAIYIVHIVTRTLDDDIHASINVSILTGTIDVGDSQRTVTNLVDLLVNVTANTFLVTTTINPTDGSAFCNNLSSTRNTANSFDIGSWIWNPFAFIILDRIKTVTSTEYITNLEATVDGNFRLRNRCRVTATIYILNTCIITSVDFNLGILSVGRQVVGQVTTTINRMEFPTVYSMSVNCRYAICR